MAKAELKTKETSASVDAFIEGQIKETADDCRAIARILEKVTGEAPRMWGASIVGFGRYHYKGASGREGEWFLAGFSPRKANITVYVLTGLEKAGSLLKKLGKHSSGKGCIYFKRLADVDAEVLEELVSMGVKGLEKQRIK